jgi:hypothetical protein
MTTVRDALAPPDWVSVAHLREPVFRIAFNEF